MCVNCNDSLQVNLPVGPSGVNGTNGASSYIYIASANDDQGNGFSYPQNPSQNYIAILNTSTPIVTPTQNDFVALWHLWTGPTGANGSNGTNGIDGANGAFSFQYRWSTNTTVSDPGSGYLNINNALVSAATTIVISETEVNSVNIANALSFIYGSNSTFKALITISKKGNSAVFATFVVLSGTDSGSYKTLTVAPSSYSSTAPFLSNDNLVFSFSVIGDKGTTGATGATGPTGATGATGPIGPSGSGSFPRPGSANFSVTFNTSLDTTSNPANYWTSVATAGPPVSGIGIKTFDSTGANSLTPANITKIQIAGTSNTTDYSLSVMQYLSTTFPTGLIGDFELTNVSTSLTTRFFIRDVIFTAASGSNNAYLTLYVSGGSGTALVTTNNYQLYISTPYEVVVPTIGYNRIELNNGSGTAKLVRLAAPQTADPGDLLLVEVTYTGGSAMSLGYVYNRGGSTSTNSSTLNEATDYCKKISDGVGTSSGAPQLISLSSSNQSALLQFYVVISNSAPYGRSLAYMGGDKYSR